MRFMIRDKGIKRLEGNKDKPDEWVRVVRIPRYFKELFVGLTRYFRELFVRFTGYFIGKREIGVSRTGDFHSVIRLVHGER